MAAGNSSVLLTRFNGANGSTSFVDEIGKAWIGTGGSTAISNAISNPYGASTSINFSNGAIYTPDSPDFNFGTGDFTIEFWCYPTAYGARVINRDYYTGSRWYFCNAILSVGAKIYFEIGDNWAGGDTIYSATSAASVSLNSWSHICCERQGTNLYIYINGVRDSVVGTIGSTISAGSFNAPLYVGAGEDGSGKYAGYLSDLHIIKGYAKYSGSSFSLPTSYVPKYVQTSAQQIVSSLHFDGQPPTITIPSAQLPDTPPGGTLSSLLHFNGSDGSTTFTDVSGKTWAPSNAIISTTQSKFGGSSAYFNGSNSYISTPSTADLVFGTSDFTVEAWVYPISGTNGELFQVFSNGWRDSSASGGGFSFRGGAANELVVESVRTNWTVITSIATIPGGISTNQWHHVAYVRNSSGLFIFFDGVFFESTNSTSFAAENFSNPNNRQAQVGASGNGIGAAYWDMNGYIDDLQIIKGYAKYSITNPPIIDETGRAWTNNGVTLSRNVTKFGETSGYFNGSNAYLRTSNTDDLKFSSSDDFTIEGYVNCISTTSSGGCFSIIQAGTGGPSVSVYTGNKVYFGVGNVSNVIISSASITLGSTFHFAITRQNGTVRLFINGSLDSSASNSSSFTSSDPYFQIGAPTSFTAGWYANGYIKDINIIKGFAKYTSAFTPDNVIIPRQVLALHADDFSEQNGRSITNYNVTDVYMGASLLHFDGVDGSTTFADEYGKVWTSSGAVISTANSKFGGSSGYFNGSARLYTTTDTSLNPLGNDFTVEYFFSNTTNTQYSNHFVKKSGNFNYGEFAILQNSSVGSGDIQVWCADFGGSGPLLASGGGVYNDGQQHHLAITRKGSSWYLAIDGFIVGTNTWSGAISYTNQNTVIGYDTSNTGRGYVGYIDEFQITPYAKYMSNFAVPTAPFTVDAATFKEAKFGTGAFYFNGTNSRLEIPATPDLNFGTGDFTIQAQINIKGLASPDVSGVRSGNILSITNGGTDNLVFHVTGTTTDTGTGIGFWDGFNSVGVASSTAISKNEWHHVALTRKSGVASLWVDGHKVAFGSYTGNSGGNYLISIGGRNNANYPLYFNGYIDDILVTNGMALWDADFTPPARSFWNRNEMLFGTYNHVVNSTDYLEVAQQSLSPIALYNMSNISGTTVSHDGMLLTDTSGNARHGTVYGDIVPATHLGMQCAYFGGNSGYCYSPQITALNDLTNGYTIEFCFDPDEKVNYDAMISLGRQISTSNDDDIYISKTGNTQSYGDGIDFIRCIGTSYSAITAPSAFRNNNGWKHVVAVHDQYGNRKLYINGILCSADTATLPATVSARDRIYIGKRGAHTNAYNYQGYISNVAVYNYALTEAQISNNFAEFIKTAIIASVTESIGMSSNTLYGAMLDGQATSSSTYDTFLDANRIYNITGTDSATMSETAEYVFKAVNVITDTINEALLALSSTDAVYIQFASATESLTLSVSFSAIPGWAVKAVSSMEASDAMPNTPVLYGGIAIDTLNAVSQLMVTLPAFVTDAIVGSDEGQGFLLILKTIIDTLSASESLSADRAILALIGEDLSISDEFNTQALLQAIVKDQIIVSVKGKQGDQLWTGYCLNKNIGATSIYENFKFNSYASLDGKYYGCAKDGIYELDMSDTDGGEKINAMFTTGLVDCGNSLKKSIDNAFLAVRTDGEVYLRIRADGQEETYKLSRDNVGKFEGARVKIGKGLRAVNWQFELFNSDGSDFDIDSMKIYPLMLTRHGGGGAR